MKEISDLLNWPLANTYIAALTLGDAPFGRFPATYPGIESLLPSVRFYRGTYALQEALHSFRSGDREAYDAGMATYV